MWQLHKINKITKAAETSSLVKTRTRSCRYIQYESIITLYHIMTRKTPFRFRGARCCQDRKASMTRSAMPPPAKPRKAHTPWGV